MKKRFLAILLCLSVLLMACACAAETMEPPAVSETESKAPAPQFTLSEVNAESSKTEEPAAPSETAPTESEPEETISMEESDIELKPIQPIVPEKKETTLEKVLSFDIGENGLFSYHFMYPQDPNPEGNESRHVSVVVPDVHTVDEKGNLYLYHVTDGQPYIYCANTGERFLVAESGNVASLYAARNRFFVSGYVPRDGFLEYDQNGFVKQYLSKEYTLLTGLYFDSQGTPYVQIPKEGIYTLEGEKAEISSYPQYRTETDGIQTVTYGNYQNVGSLYDKLYGDRFIQTDGRVYTVYDLSENTLYCFGINCAIDLEREIDLGISDGRTTLATYHPYVMNIGKTTLEALQINVITAWDGTMYLLAFYPEHADLYRIEPGYSDPTSEGISADEDAIASSSVAYGVPIGCEAHSEDHSHAHVTAEEALARAEGMCSDEYQWTLLDGHAPTEGDGLPNGVKIPKHIAGKDAGTIIKKIPYCYNGYYGWEEEWRDSFADAVTMTSNGTARYITGNTCSDGGVSGTIGLDCSGFVSSVYDFYLKCSSLYLDTCGHEIFVPNNPTAAQLNALLQPMDLIVAERYHCMLYLGPSNSPNHIWVYDCAAGGNLTEECTNMRHISLTHLITNGYIYRRMTCEYDSDATTHRYMCAYCDYTSAVAEHEWEVPDATKPNEKHCKICNYCSLHTFTYLATSATSHTRTCTVCGYSDTVDHTFTYTSISGTQHTKTCTGCGYSTTESHGGPCIAISPTQHVKPCMACGHSVTENHDMNESYNLTMHTHYCGDCGYSVSASHDVETEYDSTSHWDQCTGCDYTNMNEAHTFTYTTYSGVAHRKTCSVCGYFTTLLHVFVYDYNEEGHWRECTDCGYETAMSAHTYANSRCTVCNMQMLMKAPPVIAIPEEDEPLPVPEDQKATL